jgi:hypothetical protein
MCHGERTSQLRSKTWFPFRFPSLSVLALHKIKQSSRVGISRFLLNGDPEVRKKQEKFKLFNVIHESSASALLNPA